MKLPPLPMIDLARIAGLSAEEKLKALKRHKGGGGSWSYDPARGKSQDAFQATPPLGLTMQPVEWAQIAADLTRSCTKSAEQRDSNIEVAKILFDWVRNNRIQAVAHPFPNLALGKIAQVRYWENLLFEYQGRRYALFLDHRRDNGLVGPTSAASRFAFSAMHHHIRMRDPEFAEYGMAIIRFPILKDGGRTLSFYSDERTDHHSFEELDAMVAETYAIWQRVCEERRAAGAAGEPSEDEPLFAKLRRKG